MFKKQVWYLEKNIGVEIDKNSEHAPISPIFILPNAHQTPFMFPEMAG
jgi:hypothetical protein